jgi:hypothetical protein
MVKLQRAESPLIVWQSWSNSASPGGTINQQLSFLDVGRYLDRSVFFFSVD